MPIAPAALTAPFITARSDETLADLLKRLPQDRSQRLTFAVVAPLDDGRYLLATWVELETMAWDLAETFDARRKLALRQVRATVVPVAAVESDAYETDAAKAFARQQPGQRLVVLRDGRVAGVIVLATADTPAEADPLATPEGAVLGDHGEPEQPPPPAEPGKPAEDTRVFNAWVADQEATAPLQLEQEYVLCFNVDSPRSGAQTARFDAAKAFQGLPPEVKQVDITVAIDSEDFELLGDDQAKLTVPREGKSRNTARFDIKPKHNGVGTVNAVFIANNRIFQKMTITLQVGELTKGTTAWAAETRGLAMSGAMPAAPSGAQGVNLVIERRDAGYTVKLIGGVTARAFLNLSETKIAELILFTRDKLKELVYLKSPANQFVYQQADTQIDAAVHTESLKILAKVGFYLYQELFFAPGNGEDAQKMGKLLRQLSQQQQLQISIIAERFIFPWALLFDREKVDQNTIDPQSFWGFKHIVEYLPEFANPTPVSFIPQIKVEGAKLKLGFVCNTTIDDELTRKGFGAIVKPQSEYLKSLQGVETTEYPNRGDLYGLLGNPENAEQILYFYCHAVSNLPGEQGGVDGSKFLLSDGAATVRDMKFEAPITGDPLKHAPLVFLNACQSAELSPFLYDGLIPYLVGKGVRGVIGTEVDTPALFAAEFARDFLTRFVAGGVPLGRLLLDMRREYLERKNNVMGLLYALYSNGEVVVVRSEA